LTQHMQLIVSTRLSAEQRHVLSHSHVLGNGLAVPHAAHRHRPHITQMIESEPEFVGEFGCCVTLVSLSRCVVFGLLESEEKGGVVITDTELVGGRE